MANSSGYIILTDPHQKKDGFYRVVKTTNSNTTLSQYMINRAKRDVECLGFYACNDLSKLENLVKPALKNKLVSGSTDWVFCPDEKSVEKLKNTIETLCDIANDN